MLGSWFGNKDADDKSRDLLAVPAGPTSGDKDNSRGPRSLASAISTPHDAVLADLHGHSKATTGTPGYPGTSASHISHQTLGASPPGSTVPAPELVHDPFEGNLLGTFVPPDANLHPEAYDPLSDAANKNEELWSHLSSVLELQSQIAGLHVGMEGIGSKAGDYGKGKGKGPILKTGKRAWQESKLRVETNDESVGTGEDEGVEADEEEQKNREREEEFARLADQFEGRKEGINEIMNKLDELSKTLTQFHALPEPKIDFPPSSRHNSLSITAESPSPTGMMDQGRRTPFSPLSGSSIRPVSPAHSLPRKSHPPPGLILNVSEPGRQTHAMESPISTVDASRPYE